MPKNIIICCDGTDNKLTINENTNVIHLYSCLEKSNLQVTYYHPGVGTLTPDSVKGNIKRNYLKFKDKLFAKSLESNVKSAYLFLMNHYEEGDSIYLFGFSRGAYTVRMLSGMLHLFGLLHKGNEDNLKYALEIYSENKELFRLANSFKAKFSRKVEIRFMGIWDTVVATGGLFRLNNSFPFSGKLSNVQKVRHAVSIDERRKYYDYYKIDSNHTNFKEVFFAGVHSDVGGSYPQEGLSKLALEWMLGEASNEGLRLNQEKVDELLYGLNNRYQQPNLLSPIHNSLKWYFILAELIPKICYGENGSKSNWYFDFRFCSPRKIPLNAMLHESVFQKLKHDSKYNPKNINRQNSQYIEVYNDNIIYH